jgi:hypothetical protein
VQFLTDMEPSSTYDGGGKVSFTVSAGIGLSITSRNRFLVRSRLVRTERGNNNMKNNIWQVLSDPDIASRDRIKEAANDCVNRHNFDFDSPHETS